MKKKYELLFTREFLRKAGELDRQVQIRILREIKALEDDSFQ
jgi:mRNA-degrading endonuclease RelE of RelBE toxin-antitoxin system